MNRALVRTVSVAALLACALCASLAAAGCASGRSSEPRTAATHAARAGVPPRVRLRHIGQFHQPVLATGIPGTSLIAVVEQGGTIRAVSHMACSPGCPPRVRRSGPIIVDVRSSTRASGERGLLGLAFHLRWPADPRIFINYTDQDGATRIEEWRLARATARGVRSRTLFRIAQPFANHNGGNLAFGPDGLLYIGMGDGGSGGDPGDRAQSPRTLLGKLLRIDVDARSRRGYGIPPGNLSRTSPIWGIGLRNPWRFSFDARTGDLWIGDVGQDRFEEIDAVSARQLRGAVRNFQWRRREGFASLDASGARGPGIATPPVLAYGRTGGCSVTGGMVYRGARIKALRGWYVFADFCASELRFVRAAGLPGTRPGAGRVRYRAQRGAANVVSFGATRDGELLVVSNDGAIRQIVPVRQGAQRDG